MKYSQYRSFEKHLQEAGPDHYSPVYLVLSKDEFERKQCTAKILQCLLQEESNKDLAFKSVEGGDSTWRAGDIMQFLGIPNFFVKRQVLLISQIDKCKSAVVKEIEGALDQLSKQSFLILEGSSLNAATNFYKKIEKAGIIAEIVLPEKSWEKEKIIGEWLAAEVAAEGKNIQSAAVQLMVQSLGTDKALLWQELQKLFCYIGKAKDITPHEVQAICLTIPQESVWKLGNALFSGDLETALRIGKVLVDEGGLIPLLRQLRTQFQNGCTIASLLQLGRSEEVAKRFPYMKGNVLSKNLQTAQNYGLKRYYAALMALERAEFDAKDSALAPETLLERLIIKVTTP